jgi:hypothetical protein
MSLTTNDIAKELLGFMSTVEKNHGDRRITLMTGQKGLEAINKAIALEPWHKALDLLTLRKDRPLNKVQYSTIKDALKSDDSETAALAKVLIELRENEFVFTSARS